MRGGWLPRAEVDGEQGVPGGGVAAGHVVEDEARGGEVAVVGVGGEESGPGDDVPTGHLVEQLLGVAEAAAAAVRREQRIEVGRVGAARRGILLCECVLTGHNGESGGGRGSWQSQSQRGHCPGPGGTTVCMCRWGHERRLRQGEGISAHLVEELTILRFPHVFQNCPQL